MLPVPAGRSLPVLLSLPVLRFLPAFLSAPSLVPQMLPVPAGRSLPVLLSLPAGQSLPVLRFLPVLLFLPAFRSALSLVLQSAQEIGSVWSHLSCLRFHFPLLHRKSNHHIPDIYNTLHFLFPAVSHSLPEPTPVYEVFFQQKHLYSLYLHTICIPYDRFPLQYRSVHVPPLQYIKPPDLLHMLFGLLLFVSWSSYNNPYHPLYKPL